MITALTLISIVGAVLLIFACYRADWKAIDEQNRQFYVDGYHIVPCKFGYHIFM